jgi:hypothetical protein
MADAQQTEIAASVASAVPMGNVHRALTTDAGLAVHATQLQRMLQLGNAWKTKLHAMEPARNRQTTRSAAKRSAKKATTVADAESAETINVKPSPITIAPLMEEACASKILTVQNTSASQWRAPRTAMESNAASVENATARWVSAIQETRPRRAPM